ncbi:MAG: N-acetyltransferase [Phycisphaerae bacterium]|nr:N-acetyltransferase [Phycisphaerae bacterium]
MLSVLAAPSSGRTATIFATQARTESDVVTLALLVDRACRAAHDLDVDLAQALVDPTEHRQLSVFARGGLTRLAALSYLERPLSPFNLPTTPVFPEDLRTERWNPTERAEMIAALEQTYLDTLDCPALAGLRRGDDILEGHMHSGIFEPSLWTVLRYVSGSCAGSVAGVCLFNASPPTAIEPAGSIELVYFGLVPSARGRGIGRMLLHHGLSLLKKRRETTLILAVDDRNTPALAIYRDEGFRTRFRRIAFIRPVTRAPDIGPAHRAPA